MTDNKKIVAAYEPILAINLSASPLKTFSGKVATVSWATTGATSCQGSWNAPTSGLSMSGTFVTPPLVATTTYSMTCSNSLNKSLTKSVTITVLPATSTHLTAKDLGIIVNDNDPDSIIIANYYKEKRGIPEANIVHVKLPIKAQLTPAEFASVRTQINTSLPSTVQAVAVAWTNPSRVNCNSITSVIATDYNGSICGSGILSATSSLYYDSYSQKPFTDFKIRPAMMLAGKSVADVKALIDRGVSSDASRPKGKAYIMKTTDSVRSLRSAVYPSEKQGYAISPDVDIKMLSSNAVSSTTDTLFYFQGLASVGKIATNKFPAGAVADHLTSYGGKLTDSSQMSILEFISAGVTGTYGTVSEPYATGSKFPEPVVMMTHYTQGDSLIEAYWKSVAVPCQGIFVGDPLATPWAN